MTSTTNAISLNGISGSDGIVPVLDPNSRFTIWSLDQIFMGQGTPGEGRYVPKAKDWVIDLEAAKFYTVLSIDAVTLTPRLKAIDPLKQDQQFSDADLILGVGPGTIHDTFRIYVNKNVVPHTLTLDSRLHVFTEESERYTVFKGSRETGDAKPISQLYNQSGELIGTSIPLAVVAKQGNISTKGFPGCYTTEDLQDGDVVVVITYSDAGHEISSAELKVVNTEFTPVADASTKYITSISLESPFISPSVPNEVRYPMNVPLNGLALVGVVNYSDNSKVRMPVNNTKFRVRGFEQFISTNAGISFDLVLDYVPSANEVALGLQLTSAGTVSRRYTAITTNFEGMYSPKLFCYPVWVDPVNGYRLEWFLYDMERRLAMLVTPYVKFNPNSKPFDPVGYGFRQSLAVTINLKDVNPSGLAFNHVQTVDVVLRQPGDARTTNWSVGYLPHQDILFGDNNFAKTTIIDQNQMTIDVSCGETDKAAWLQRLYRLVYPLTDQLREVQAPDPTHFTISSNSWDVVYPIDKWNEVLTLNYTLANNATVFIKFLIRTPDTDIQLAIAAMPCYAQ